LKKLDLTHVVMYVVFLIVGWGAAVMIWNQYRFQVILLALAAITFFVLRFVSKHNKKKKDDEDGNGQGGVHVHFH
jgi:phosphotransferase system  glucose/maltose/N-acetylglucosamine-specific IIC component